MGQLESRLFGLTIALIYSPSLIYFIFAFEKLGKYFKTKDKVHKKAILRTLLLTYDFGLFATIPLISLTAILFPPTTSSGGYILESMIAFLLISGALWQILRSVIGVIFWFKYRSTKNIQKKKILKENMDWGFNGIWLLLVISSYDLLTGGRIFIFLFEQFK